MKYKIDLFKEAREEVERKFLYRPLTKAGLFVFGFLSLGVAGGITTGIEKYHEHNLQGQQYVITEWPERRIGVDDAPTTNSYFMK